MPLASSAERSSLAVYAFKRFGLGALDAVGVGIALFLLTLVGSVAVSWLEADAEDVYRAAYQKEMLALNATYNFSDEHFARLQELIGVQVAWDPADEEGRKWVPVSANTTLFALTIVSTIGYGTLAPTTDEGRIFLIFYAILGLPICGVLTLRFATHIISGIQFLVVVNMNDLDEKFDELDDDDSGTLDSEEFRVALEDLKIEGLTQWRGKRDAEDMPMLTTMAACGDVDIRKTEATEAEGSVPRGRNGEETAYFLSLLKKYSAPPHDKLNLVEFKVRPATPKEQ